MASIHTYIPGIGVSYISPGTLITEKLGDGPRPSNDLVRRHDIIRSYNRTPDYRNPEMIVCNVRPKTVSSIWPDAFPHSDRHRPTEKTIGHLFVL
ncbi:MAG: hypothetical protein WA621_16505 [Candidatus Acidiferrum sp.]